MKQFIAGLVVGLGVAVGSAWAGFYDGNWLHTNLTTGSDNQEIHAGGYIVGVYDTVEALQEFEKQSGGSTPRRMCVPTGVTAGQLRDVVLKVLDMNPEVRHDSGASIVWGALINAFPCEE